MAWGKAKTQHPPSTIKVLLPLLIALVFLSVVAWVCYQIYLSLSRIQAQARKQMGDNVVFSKDGVRLTVPNVEAESYLDATQSWVVKAWNLSSSSSTEASKRKSRNVFTKPRPGEGHD